MAKKKAKKSKDSIAADTGAPQIYTEPSTFELVTRITENKSRIDFLENRLNALITALEKSRPVRGI